MNQWANSQWWIDEETKQKPTAIDKESMKNRMYARSENDKQPRALSGYHN